MLIWKSKLNCITVSIYTAIIIQVFKNCLIFVIINVQNLKTFLSFLDCIDNLLLNSQLDFLFHFLFFKPNISAIFPKKCMRFSNFIYFKIQKSSKYRIDYWCFEYICKLRSNRTPMSAACQPCFWKCELLATCSASFSEVSVSQSINLVVVTSLRCTEIVCLEI